MDEMRCRYCGADRDLQPATFGTMRCAGRRDCATRSRLQRHGLPVTSSGDEECWHCGAPSDLEFSRYGIWRCTDRDACAHRPRVIRRRKFDGPSAAFVARFEPGLHARLMEAAQRETAFQATHGLGGVSMNDLVCNAVADLLDRIESAWEEQERASG
jgi:hypothetical protein